MSSPFFVSHRSIDCPNDFPDPVNYKTITARDVETAKRARKGKTVASVATVDDNSEDEAGLSVNPIAVVLGQSVNPVAYMPTNDSSVIGSGSDSDSDTDVSIPLAALTQTNPLPARPAP